MSYAEELARQSITREARAFAGAIESDLNDWTEDECRTFLRQFAAHVQQADAVVVAARRSKQDEIPEDGGEADLGYVDLEDEEPWATARVVEGGQS